MPQPSDSSPNARGQRLISFAAVGAILACIVWFYLVTIHPLIQHRKVRNKMDIAILRLSEYRPPELTNDQWAYCVMWTWNLHCNAGWTPSDLPTADLERIRLQLLQMTEHRADLETIDWIWDQYIQASPRTKQYDHFRPTAESNRESFVAGRHGDNPLPQWIERYHQRVAEQKQ